MPNLTVPDSPPEPPSYSRSELMIAAASAGLPPFTTAGFTRVGDLENPRYIIAQRPRPSGLSPGMISSSSGLPWKAWGT
jgi:hypothetical protein